MNFTSVTFSFQSIQNKNNCELVDKKKDTKESEERQ